MPADPAYLTLTDVLASFRDRSLSPVTYMEHVLNRVAQHNPTVNAFFSTDPDGALTQAREAEERWRAGTPKGRLDGIPFSVKDHILTKGMPSPWGTTAVDLAGPWVQDAPAVSRLKEEGAILIGKTTQPELASLCSGLSGLYGVGRNPWNLERSPGGSSGGAAAALAADMGPLAFGSDGGGSIRIPAAYSGVVGYKPTFGRIPFFPPVGSGAVYGPMTRSARDLPVVMNIVTRPDWMDVLALPYDAADYTAPPAPSLRGKRIALSDWFGYGVATSDGVSSAFRQAARVFAELRAEVVPIEPFFDDDPYDRLAPMVFAGIAGMSAALTGGKTDQLLPELQNVIAKASAITLPEYLGAAAQQTPIMLRVAEALNGFDFLVTPTMPTVAYPAHLAFPEGSKLNRYGYCFDHNPFTWLFNVTLQPAVSLPCGFSEGLPVGLQIVGGRGDDLGCIHAAIAFEDALGLGTLRPPLAV